MKAKIIIFSLFSLLSFAQNKEIRGYVYYGENDNIFNSGNREVRGNLIFTKEQSSYVTGRDSLNQLYQNQIDASNLVPTNNTIDKGDGRIVYSSGNEDNIRDHVNYAIHTKKDSVDSVFEYGSTKYGDYHYLRQAKPIINWVLIKETKKLGGFECYKATCRFRGRDYIAWYAPEIAVPYGPWKFQGLPGLILEVYTINKEIYFYAKKIVYPLNNQLPLQKINKPLQVKWMHTTAELLKRQDIILQDTYDYANLVIASMPNATGRVIKSTSKEVFKEFEE